MPDQSIFELEIELPDSRIEASASRLIGFENRYARIKKDLLMLTNPASLNDWSTQFHGTVLPLCGILIDRYPLIVFEGDVGTGKTATAEACCDKLARDIGKPAFLFKLSTRVRGSGMVGSMSHLINETFRLVTEEAGKNKYSFLIIDEADSLASSRSLIQSHHEDKVGVNTLIQKIDDIRKHSGRVLVFVSTNRIEALDPAVLRRASRIEHFDRPNEIEREALIRADCNGVNISDDSMKLLIELTGTNRGKRPYGMTYSDMRLRWLPEAINLAFPSRQLTAEDLIQAAMTINPTPPVSVSKESLRQPQERGV